MAQHREDLRKNAEYNSLALHIAEKHPEYRGDSSSIIFSVSNTGKKSLERQVREAIKIANTDPTKIINGRNEYIRPAIQRMTHGDLLDDNRGRAPGST